MNILSFFRAKSINTLLITSIVLLSSGITLLTTALQLFMDYHRDIEHIERVIGELELSSIDSIEASLWVMDMGQVELLITGISQLPDMQYIAIEKDSNTVAAAGTYKDSGIISSRFELTYPYDGATVELGELTVAATLSGVYRRLLNKTLVILASNGLKTFSVALFFFFIFGRLVTRHLNHIAAFTSKISMDTPVNVLRLDREVEEGRIPDELDQVVQSLNEMQQRLHSSYSDLRQKDELISSIYQSTDNIGFITTDIRGDDSRIKTFSPGAENIFGYRPEEVIGNPVAMLHLPEDVLRFTEMQEKLKKGDKAFSGETLLVRKSEEAFPALLTIHPLLDSSGQLAGSIGVAVDITEQQQARKELHRKEEILQQMSRTARIGGWEFDAETLEGTWTEETARIHDLDPDSPTNVEVGLNLYKGESRRKIESAVQDAIEEGVPYDLELEIITGKGNQKWVRTIGLPIKAGGRVIKVRGTIQDITELKHNRDELAKHQHHLTELVRKRTDELQQIINTMAGREIRMSELKEQNRRLHDKIKHLEPSLQR